LHNQNLAGNIPEELRVKVFNFLKNKLHEMAIELENKVLSTHQTRVFQTLVRAVYRIGLYNELRETEMALYSQTVPMECYTRPEAMVFRDLI
jgi:hypothetical protein